MKSTGTVLDAPAAADAVSLTEPADLMRRFRAVRSWSETLCSPLSIEDYVIQSMPDASPAKWHLAHTSWFFEKFLLERNVAGYSSPHPQYEFLFNSYYNSLGARHCRPKRGFISRPTVADTYAYRRHVDASMCELLCNADAQTLDILRPMLELGINHEQQHQELIVTDLKHMLAENPLMPVYLPRHSGVGSKRDSAEPLRWQAFDGGLRDIGFSGSGFSFDNETPRHREYLVPFAVGSRLVTNGEYLEFIADGGYSRPEYWLSEGWAAVQARDWEAPMYWQYADGRWHIFTLHGFEPIDHSEPVCHVSLYEADAFAHWAAARLPTESEWEAASTATTAPGAFAESKLFHPSAARGTDQTVLSQMLGDVWEWTRSQYSPYPGYKQADGALGEYNGKFMCNQFVLRGGSCATPLSHIRTTYRNFFPPDARWQFTGIRLAKDL